ncbi:MAG: ornithine--oxo-acid transaminase, partial [Caldiserica bacterium]|nr:ornithine--oxo-acid transaminase [Caldisericota bacterium]
MEDRYGAHNYHPLPVVLAKGEGVFMWDVEGKRYFDFLSAYSAVNHGHLHPKIIGAVKDQLERITLTSRAFFNDKLPLFVERVCKFTGKEMFLPMNSGAEGVETAIKAMRKWGYEVKGIPAETGNIIVMEQNFHGRTITIISFSTDEGSHKHFGPHTPGFKIVKYNDIKAIEESIDKNTIGVMLEPIQGEAGVVVPDDGYLTAVSKLCKQAGILFCADEIQTGFGRTGKRFCCDHENVTPDIYILGKALGGGIMPVSGVAANRDILDVIKAGQHGSTFGGNPLASVVGIAAMDVLEEEKLIENSATLGNYFMGELKKIAGDKIDLVRGKGLLIGIRIAEKYGKAKPFIKALKAEGILAKDTHEKIIRFAPPIVITKEEIDWAMQGIKKVFA